MARLKAAIPSLSDRVYNARAEALGDPEIPCICVSTKEEDVETLDNNPTTQLRTLSLAVEVIVSGSGTIDDDLDDLCEQVEDSLLSGENQDSPGLWQEVTLVITEMGFVDSGRRPIGAARMIFNFSYGLTIT